MADSLPLSVVARPLVSVAQTLSLRLRRILQERQAGRMPFKDDTDLMERGLDATLARIRGGDVDDTWWQNLLHQFGHAFITPDFLRKPALQEWLADEQVARDAKALARDCLLGAGSDDAGIRTRLQQAYAARTGEHEQLANGPIDVVVAILAAGYVASIPSGDQPLAGMVQAIAQENRGQFEAIQHSLEKLGPDHHVVQVHSKLAERALSVLLKQRSIISQQDRVRQDFVDRPVYLADIAVMHLQETSVLQAICRRSDMNLLIHPSLKTYQTTLIEENRAGDNLAHDLDAIRLVLRGALETGQAIFLPSAPWYASDPQRSELYQSAPTLTHILQDVRSCDAVCVDDRFVNRHPFLSDNAGRTTPTLCILDLLRYLEGQGIIRTEEKHQAFHQLRQAGYVLVPVEPDELEKHMRQARIDQEGSVIENAEMRTCRQTLMRVRSLDMIDLPTESLFLDKLQFACIVVIRRLWTDETMSAEHAVALSDWIWSILAPSPLDWARGFHESSPQFDIQEAFARHIAILLQPIASSQERDKVFRTWVESEVLEPLLPANADMVDRITKFARTNIERLSEEFGNDEDIATRSLSV